MNVVLLKIALRWSAVSNKFIMNWLVLSLFWIGQTSVWSTFAVKIAAYRNIISTFYHHTWNCWKKKIFLKRYLIICARVCNPFAFCVHSPLTVYNRSPNFVNRADTVRSAFAHRLFSNRSPGDSRMFQGFQPEILVSRLKITGILLIQLSWW